MKVTNEVKENIATQTEKINKMGNPLLPDLLRKEERGPGITYREKLRLFKPMLPQLNEIVEI